MGVVGKRRGPALTVKSQSHRSQPKPCPQASIGKLSGHPWNHGLPGPGHDSRFARCLNPKGSKGNGLGSSDRPAWPAPICGLSPWGSRSGSSSGGGLDHPRHAWAAAGENRIWGLSAGGCDPGRAAPTALRWPACGLGGQRAVLFGSVCRSVQLVQILDASGSWS